MLLYAVLALVLGAVSAQSPLARQEIAQPKSLAADYQLPGNLRPSLYEIELEPNFVTDTFNGTIRITFNVVIETNQVILHTYQLDVDVSSISLLDQNGNVVNSVAGTSYSNDDRQFYTITFVETLVEGQIYILALNSFTGILNNQNDGFYLAKYTDENGVERKLATTQFEATSARRAFPCFDEPALKAEFEITIFRTSEYDSISNTPKISVDEISEGRFQDRFARTVGMSTYLIAFVISDFAFVEELNHRVFGRPAVVADHRADYALVTGIGVLNAISDFVDVPYTLDKMDQIGLPDGYFSAGAMENWGLVTYREAYLMYANRITASNYRESIATIIAHEFGHQWFGNLVSPFWWTYIWLNEGFATYFEYYGASVVEEDMELMNQIVIKTVQYALGRDSTTSTRPMNQEVGSPRDISSIFDTVAYDKSGSVIRMVEGIISTAVFRRGLNLYLNKMQFDAAQPTDLYTSWQQAVDEAGTNPLPDGVDMSALMSTWDSNAGYPLITVSRDYSDGSVTLTQRRFLTANPNNDDESIWYVPISYATGTNVDFANTTPRLWLMTRSETVSLNDLGLNDWLLINIQESGYYRVNYDTENWNRIINFVNSERFNEVSKLNRAQLLDDSFTFARYGVIDYAIPLSLIQYIVRETDYIPLYPFITSLSFLDTFMSNTEIYEDFKNLIVNLLAAAVDSVGFDETEEDRHVTKLNRVNMLTWACKYGRQDCREFGLMRLREWETDEDRMISPNLQTPLTCAGLRIAEQNDWNFVFRRYVDETESLVRTRLLNALGCSENEDILNGFMNIILDTSSDLRSSDRLSALSSIYNSGNFGRDYVYNYIKNNWTAVSASLTTSQISSVMNGIAGKFSTQEQYDDLRAFGQQVNAGSTFNSALNTINSNINWADQYMPSILNFFNES